MLDKIVGKIVQNYLCLPKRLFSRDLPTIDKTNKLVNASVGHYVAIISSHTKMRGAGATNH